MSSFVNALSTVQISAGEEVPVAAPGCGWRLESGALRLHTAQSGAPESLVSLALPGDLVGVDRLAGAALPLSGVAILPTKLSEFRPAQGDLPTTVNLAYIGALQRSADMVVLRGGSVPNRVRYLLLLIADNHRYTTDVMAGSLPSLRDIADIVGSTRETVSRVLGNMKRNDLLHHRKAQWGILNVPDLRQFSFLPGMTCSAQLAKQRLGDA